MTSIFWFYTWQALVKWFCSRGEGQFKCLGHTQTITCCLKREKVQEKFTQFILCGFGEDIMKVQVN